MNAVVDKFCANDYFGIMNSSVNLSLPVPLKEWIQSQVTEGGYKTASDFIGDLVRAEQRRQLRRHIDDRLHQALDSGPPTPLTKEDWKRIRREGRKRLAAKKRTRA